MDRPSRELYQSFARLNNTSPEIIEWLKQGYEDQKETNIFSKEKRVFVDKARLKC